MGQKQSRRAKSSSRSSRRIVDASQKPIHAGAGHENRKEAEMKGQGSRKSQRNSKSVPADTYDQAASNLVAGNNLEQTIQQIMDIGGGTWDKEIVTRALRAADNNAERAVEYLYSGIPETAEDAVPVAPFPANQAAGGVNPATETGAAPAAHASGAPNSSPLNMFPQEALSAASGGGLGSLDLLRNNQQGMPSPVIHDAQTSVASTATQTAAEAAELAMAISASVQSASGDRPSLMPNVHQNSEASNKNGWGNSTVSTSNEIPASFSSDPSAPPIPEEGLYEGPIHYPSIDLSPVDLSVPAIEAVPSEANDKDDVGDSSSCVICWEAPIECACIPCGHMAGCMSCLNEIKAKKGVCPVCRTKMDEVIKLYAVR